MVFQTQVSLGLIWVSRGSVLPAPSLPCFSPAKSTQDGGLRFWHLGKQQQRAASLGICVLVPEVKQFWGEDGGREEPQEEKATYGQVLHILPREATGERSLPKPSSQLGKSRQQGLHTGDARGSKMGDGSGGHPGLPRRLFLSEPQFLHLGNVVIMPILCD